MYVIYTPASIQKRWALEERAKILELVYKDSESGFIYLLPVCPQMKQLPSLILSLILQN